jgi:hypothetical protein
MMRRAFLGALLLAASAALHAQAGREAFRNAAQVCRTEAATEQRNCMARELCRNNRDPARCEERYHINAERRDKVLEACKGKQGVVLRNCMREEYKKLGPAPRP